MPRINLLPWREELRQKRKKEFITWMFMALLLAGLTVYASKLTVNGWISDQQNRNQILRTEIAQLDAQIAEIRGLENQKERLLARMAIIEQLQRSRPEAVYLLDQLVETLPEGVHLNEVRQSNTRIEMRGSAQSSTRVSALMRNIDASPWLRSPGLEVVETVTSGGSRTANFTLFAQQIPMTDQNGGDSSR